MKKQYMTDEEIQEEQEQYSDTPNSVLSEMYDELDYEGWFD